MYIHWILLGIQGISSLRSSRKKVLKSRDVKFLQKFQENEDETSSDFVDIEVITDSCNKENLPQDVVERTEQKNLEERNEEPHDENEEDAYERRERNHHEDEDSDTRAPAMRLGRGRPRIIRTGKPRRPAKRKQEVPVGPRKIDSESEEDTIIAEVENYEDIGEFAEFTYIESISAEQALKSPEADKWKRPCEKKFRLS